LPQQTKTHANLPNHHQWKKGHRIINRTPNNKRMDFLDTLLADAVI